MNKKILITGAAGFIGHNIVDTFLELTDYDIVTLDRLDFSGTLNRLHEVINTVRPQDKHRVKFFFHDLKAEINQQLAQNIGDIHYIFHIAAASHVDRSIIDPMSFVLDNVVGTCNILNFARLCKNLKRFVYFSTDEVFGAAPPGVKYDERARYNSSNPYSASKAGGEELAVAYHNTYNLPVYIFHTVNVFGIRQNPEKYIPKCIKTILNDQTILVHNDAKANLIGSRYYVHVRDVSEALLFVCNLKEDQLTTIDYGGAKCPKFNITGSQEIDNLEVAKTIASVLNKPCKYKLIDCELVRPGLDLRYSLSGELLSSLGWKPRFTFTERIKEVVQWTLKNRQWL